MQIIAERPVLLFLDWAAALSALAFIAMGTDKLRAKRKKRRIPEATLFLLALLGGSAGGVLGMLCFRHKTRHRLFAVSFPFLLILHMALAVFIART